MLFRESLTNLNFVLYIRVNDLVVDTVVTPPGLHGVIDICAIMIDVWILRFIKIIQSPSGEAQLLI